MTRAAWVAFVLTALALAACTTDVLVGPDRPSGSDAGFVDDDAGFAAADAGNPDADPGDATIDSDAADRDAAHFAATMFF